MDDFTTTLRLFVTQRQGRIVCRGENRCLETASRENIAVCAQCRIAFWGGTRALLECRLFPESILRISNYSLKALILGVVEGLTEFLPVSSTGHLILAGDLLDFNDERGKLFEIVVSPVQLWRLSGNTVCSLAFARAWPRSAGQPAGS